MRIFIGTSVNEQIARKLVELQELFSKPLGENYNFIPRERFHMTLRFLGELSIETIPQLTDSLSSHLIIFAKINFKHFLAKILLLTCVLEDFELQPALIKIF